MIWSSWGSLLQAGPACTAVFQTPDEAAGCKCWHFKVNRPLLRKSRREYDFMLETSSRYIIGNVKHFVDVKHLIFFYDRDGPGVTQLTRSDSIADKLELDRWWHGKIIAVTKGAWSRRSSFVRCEFSGNQNMCNPAGIALSSTLLPATSICMNSFQHDKR